MLVRIHLLPNRINVLVFPTREEVGDLRAQFVVGASLQLRDQVQLQ
jgi:hypothetical protein